MSAFVSAMRFVGDLDNEFYHDEHQRDVWNEASAIGFQLFIWASAIAMAVLPWAAGVTGAWVSLGIFSVFGVVSLATLAYSKSRRVDVQARSKPFQPRGIVFAIIYLVAGVGVITRLDLLASTPGESSYSTWSGAVVGGVAGAGGAAFYFYWTRKKQRELDAREEDL